MNFVLCGPLGRLQFVAPTTSSCLPPGQLLILRAAHALQACEPRRYRGSGRAECANWCSGVAFWSQESTKTNHRNLGNFRGGLTLPERPQVWRQEVSAFADQCHRAFVLVLHFKPIENPEGDSQELSHSVEIRNPQLQMARLALPAPLLTRAPALAQ